MITLSLKAKEAIKLGLAMVLVYGIALQLDWMNPSWAGFTVAFISLATVGESLHKGAQRLFGTIPGCIMALAILGLVPQDRWLFIVLVSMWVFYTSYMTLGEKNSYFWRVAGLTFLVITTTGPESSQSAFEHAMFRTLETAMGVVVYTLVTVFLWPRTNAGALKKTSSELLAAQATLFKSYRDQLLGSYRGVSEAAIAYTAVVGDVDWAQWREERFS
jgi:uncharacterized membrane protein YccC